MEFFATNGKRPIRLCMETRKFAYESLNHKYGLSALENSAVPLDDCTDFESRTLTEKYNIAIEKIARTAPIRICKGELISGAATLGLAIKHFVPATYKDEPILGSISHLTLDFETVLRKGVDYIEKTAKDALLKYKDTPKEEFILSCLHCIECMRIWHGRYLEALKDDPLYKDNYKNLLLVPFKKASNFYEAVQSLWFVFAFTRLCGNWPGIGRIDFLLGEYLENDLKNGTQTVESAREILAHFFIKGCEWICGGDYGTGDAQHYQNILLCGVDEDGKEITNTVTYLVLDIIEELGISDFPTSVRINKNTDDRLLKRLSEVIRFGGGIIAVYNEDLVIDSLTQFGYDIKEARKFANDGCWEVQIPGKTNFGYMAIDALLVLQAITLENYQAEVDFPDFESLYTKFAKDLDCHVRYLMDIIDGRIYAKTDEKPTKWKFNTSTPCTVVSLFEQGCIQNGLSYLEGGPVYQVFSPHLGGLPDVANSLYAIKKLVYEEKRLSLPEFIKILKNDWNGNEALRQYALNKLSYFGNDNDEVDCIAKNIVDDFAKTCDNLTKEGPNKKPAGISTFGRQIEWSPHRLATPFGKKAHDVLAGNFSPTPGTDTKGATAIIKSYCKSDLKRTVCGAALDMKLLPAAVSGDNGIEAISSLLRGFVTLGGHFMQIDIANAEILKAAQENPQEYQNLSVRVSGWNARFVTLNKEWQDMIIAQTGCDF